MFIHSLDDIGTLFGILYLEDNIGCFIKRRNQGKSLTEDQVLLSKWHLSSGEYDGFNGFEWQYWLTLLRTYKFGSTRRFGL